MGWSIFTDPKRPVWVNFCEGKLYRVSWLFDGGGLMQYLKIVNDHVQNLGYEGFDSRVSVRVGYDGQDLNKEGDPYYIEIGLYATENHDITNGQITYEEWGDHKDCK